MERSGPLHQVSDVVLGLSPVNFATAANDGRWVNMANVDGMNCLIVSGIGTAGEDPVITLQQATDAAGTGAKELKIKDLAIKLGATAIGATQDKFARITSIDRDNPVSSYVNTDGAENDFLAVLYVLQQDLDVNNGFKYIRARVADVGAGAQLGLILYIPANRAYKGVNNTSLLS